MPKKTNEQFCKELYEINPNIRPLEEYNGNNTKIQFECLVCGYKFCATPSNVLQGHGCKKCGIESSKKLQRMPEEEFLERLKGIQPNLTVLSHYVNTATRVKVRCNCCGNEYTALPSNLLKGYGCRQCYRNNHKPMTREEFILKVKNICDIYDIGFDYVNGKTPCSIKCKVCGYERKVIPNLFLSKKCRCPKCDGNIKQTPQEYRDFVKSKNKSISVISDYTLIKEEVTYKCELCGKTWTERAEVFAAREFRCKYCQLVKSRMEEKISDCLTESGIDFEPQKKFDNLRGVGDKRLSYDFYIPSKRLLIEAQCAQHFRSVNYFGGEEKFVIQQEHDSRKRKYAKDNNYDLLEILESDYKNIPNIIHSRLAS